MILFVNRFTRRMLGHDSSRDACDKDGRWTGEGERGMQVMRVVIHLPPLSPLAHVMKSN